MVNDRFGARLPITDNQSPVRNILAQRKAIRRTIENRNIIMGTAAIRVLIIASHLWRSKMIPVTPNIRETGNENTISSPTRAAKGFPQPRWRMDRVRIARPPIANMSTDSNPNRIF